jgi:hypothetical protein
LLEDAEARMEAAVRLWADACRDATDRGTLAGLNTYGRDWVRGKADEMRLQSELWSIDL